MYRTLPTDKYDNPDSGGIEIVDDSAVGQAKEAAGAAGSAFKKHWKLIVVALIVIGIGYFAFDFLIGSVKTTTFNVTDTESIALPASVKVMDSGGKEIERVNSGASIKLRKGGYSARVSAAGYKAGQQSFTVAEDGEVSIKLEKNWNLELETGLPDTFVQGETRTITVSIVNNGTEEVQTGLKFEGTGFTSDKASFEFQKPIIIFPGSGVDVNVDISISPNAKPAGEDGYTGTIRIEGLDNPRAKFTKNFSLLQFNPQSVAITPVKISISTDEGILKTTPLNFSNKNKFPLEGIQIKATVLTKEHTEESVIESWFEVSETGFDIAAEDKKTVNLNFTPVLGESKIPEASNTEKITAKLEISNSYFRKEIPVDIIVNKSKVNIALESISDQPFTKTGDVYPAKQLSFNIKNNGKLAITEVIVSSTEEDACKTNKGKVVEEWITFRNSQFSSIGPQGNQEVIYFIEPKGGEKGEIATCQIRIRYTDPRTGGRGFVVSNPFAIRLN